MASPKGGDGVSLAANFPTDPLEFDSDPRISFSKLDDQFILETEDGQEFVYDSVLKRWVHQVCFCARCFAPMTRPEQTVSHLRIGLFTDAFACRLMKSCFGSNRKHTRLLGWTRMNRSTRVTGRSANTPLPPTM